MIQVLRRNLLLGWSEGPGGGSYTWTFGVPIPDPRLRTRITLLYSDPGVADYPADTPAIPGGMTLHLAARERDHLTGRLRPVTNILGTIDAGETVELTRLRGVSYQWDGGADEIFGKMVITNHQDQNTSFLVQVTYAPMVHLCPNEWAAVDSAARPYVLEGEAKLLAE